MNSLRTVAVIAALSVWSVEARAQEVAALAALYCIPDLPSDRIVAEFSRLLDQPDCASVLAKRNIETHVIGISECRSVAAVPGSERCRTFVFQIANRGADATRASGVRFAIKGTARWCRRVGGGWYPDEPDRLVGTVVDSNGPQLPDTTCRMPEGWGRRDTASLSPPPVTPPARSAPPAGSLGTTTPVDPFKDTPSSPAPVPPMVTASSQPLCRTTHGAVCTDLVTLRYLASAAASDEELHRALGEFLADERRPASSPPPPIRDLEAATAAAVTRSRTAPICPIAPTTPGSIVACGRS